ncbi:hypothetical protein F6X40_21860 [Paraburkholderia sp. UCT31]|uniref:hypothetical protein n=1 Tax=Paraburkholderia sp. UCT31 TaxID=2615209 RepID=UPI001655D8DA|nr:hypothetical protein [Paraburkholderia sp. UCT31]MBC8739392.1 hypothetical protein [Paraburkholderia sp. UCT31]
MSGVDDRVELQPVCAMKRVMQVNAVSPLAMTAVQSGFVSFGCAALALGVARWAPFASVWPGEGVSVLAAIGGELIVLASVLASIKGKDRRDRDVVPEFEEPKRVAI